MIAPTYRLPQEADMLEQVSFWKAHAQATVINETQAAAAHSHPRASRPPQQAQAQAHSQAQARWDADNTHDGTRSESLQGQRYVDGTRSGLRSESPAPATCECAARPRALEAWAGPPAHCHTA